VQVIGQVEDYRKQDIFHLFVCLLLRLFLHHEPVLNLVGLLLRLVLFLLLSKLIVSDQHLLLQIVVNVEVDFVHFVRRKGLELNRIHDVLVHVHQRVRGFVLLATDSLLEDIFFQLHSNIMVTESPPTILFTVEYKRVVMATLRQPVVHQDRVQEIRHSAVVFKCVFNAQLKVVNPCDKLAYMFFQL
jgi:hypothetical protein